MRTLAAASASRTVTLYLLGAGLPHPTLNPDTVKEAFGPPRPNAPCHTRRRWSPR
ncbi:Hypothetical protein SLIV_16087 [Streptomyces lividans TK24]|uniref:Secreted protein n=1 Tax=Streptomyces lividans TK24 TaxID=457428 RepID=A0ABX6TQZ1_STRLI|nr:Hypothetical protein SLIV_16087 [Streptomyces lividans TK24]QSJ09726.1 Hypothetical protein SLIVDG2_16087 [Streptomyces lividans]QTD70650.1 Hypothetical protein SLIVYQS_16087 [Streptomyces lividans TK24] [Streptomyces lividans]